MSDAYGDKRLHLAAYATLTCLAYASFNRRPALLALFRHGAARWMKASSRSSRTDRRIS